MKYKIELTENWRPERHSFYTPGVYRVPADLSEAMAEQAVNEGVAKRLEVLKPKPTFLGKAISSAPENKSKVVAWPGRGGGNRSVPDAGSGVGGQGGKGSRGK